MDDVSPRYRIRRLLRHYMGEQLAELKPSQQIDKTPIVAADRALGTRLTELRFPW